MSEFIYASWTDWSDNIRCWDVIACPWWAQEYCHYRLYTSYSKSYHSAVKDFVIHSAEYTYICSIAMQVGPSVVSFTNKLGICISRNITENENEPPSHNWSYDAFIERIRRISIDIYFLADSYSQNWLAWIRVCVQK